MGLSMEGQETGIGGIVLSLMVTIILWTAWFSAGWFLGLAITGSEVGAAAGAIFPTLAEKLGAKFWTRA